MKLGMFISDVLEINSNDLPFQWLHDLSQYSWRQSLWHSLKIYTKRLAVFLSVALINLIIFGIITFAQSLDLIGSIQVIGKNLLSLLWLPVTLLPLLGIQRLLHREMQAGFFIATRNAQLTIGLFSILFFPGVFLHELSHFVTAKLLRIPTGRVSLIPKSLSNGGLPMGYVETARTDIIRDSLVGVSPLIAGSLFVAYTAIYRLQLLPLWDFLFTAQWDAFQSALKGVAALPGFWFWFYLVFAVSSTMMPSESDRHAWLPLGIWVGILIALAILAGAGVWIIENLASPLNSFLRALTLTFGLSGIINIILLLPSMLLHWILSKLTGGGCQMR